MSGIAGILRRDGGPVDRFLLERMARSMEYRAVGGSAIWAGGSVGLVQLGSTVPRPPREDRPLAIECSDRFVLVFAGHIDNPEELEAELPAAAREIADTDTALALRAVEAWGDAAPERIVGPFALAAWDRKRHRLFCARDFLGMRPFFYYLSDRLFAFASDMHALFQEATIPRQINEGMAAEFLTATPTSRDETLYADVNRLVPATWLGVTADRVVSGQHWRPPTSLLRFRSEGEPAELLRTVLATAIRACVRGHDRAAVQLSGGLDSSAVAVLARRIMCPDAIDTLSITFVGLDDCDERIYIDAVNACSGGPSLAVPFCPVGVEPLVRSAERFLTVPEAPNGTMHHGLLREARSRGHRLLLDGNTGDAWLTGSHDQLADCIREADLLGLWAILRGSRSTVRGRVARLMRHGVGPLVPAATRRRFGRFLLPPQEREIAIPDWVAVELAARTHLAERLLRPRLPWHFETKAQAALSMALVDAWHHLALEFTERAASLYGLSSRSPFNDRRVVELALRLPDQLRWRGDRTKLILRQALERDLPPLVRDRRDKAEFSAVFAEEYKADAFSPLLETPHLERLGWTVPSASARVLGEIRRRYGRGDPSYKSYAWPAYAVVALEVWLRAAVG